jgi:serum/glucocorticoid-regulated kinase 2
VKESTLLRVHFAKIDEEDPSSSFETIDKDSFQYLKVIGCGGYSNVVLARKKDSGRLYAIKIIKKDKAYLKTSKSVYLAESNIMKKLTGLPFIVNLHYTFQTEDELYFVMEPCIGGTLFHFMTHCSKGDLNINIVRFYMAEIVIALERIHSKNVMYRDLKPENILIDMDGHIKISDFGLSKQMRKRDETSQTFCGSPEYLSPEMILGYEHSRAVDFYTLGCLFYEMMVGFPPFHSKDGKQLEKRIITGIIRFPVKIEEDAQHLIEWLLARDPQDRPQESSHVKQHAFFNTIHWGRVAKKEAIPPWVPGLYQSHVSKRFTQIPLSQVFMKGTQNKECKRASYDTRLRTEENLAGKIIVPDQTSNREMRKIAEKLGQSVEKMLYLEGKFPQITKYLFF